MGLRFRKSISICNGVKMNISKSGLSFTLGKNGKSINVGSKGTYLNLGLKGTGLSYRKKLTGGYNSLFDLFSEKKETEKKDKSSGLRKTINTKNEEYEEYLKDYDAYFNIHKYAEDVHPISYFMSHISDDALLQKIIAGDEDTIEGIIEKYTESIDLPYKIDVNFELENDVLFVDLDLPEIEDIQVEAYELKNNEMVKVNKTKTKMQQEYCQLIESLSIYLSAMYFNASSYIRLINLSAFTQRRNKMGDLDNEYVLSVKFEREIFEKITLKDVEDPYQFLLQFENRINVSSTGLLKEIVPFELVQQETINYQELSEGFKRLGYSANEIKNMLVELKKMNLTSEDECFKEGLRLLKK